MQVNQCGKKYRFKRECLRFKSYKRQRIILFVIKKIGKTKLTNMI